MKSILLVLLLLVAGCSRLMTVKKVVSFPDVTWQQLNPARGDQSPRAGVLWGDRTGPGPAGFLLNPKDGFRSPPHIHNVMYRGVVISGLLHNDDPGAADMFMAAGSYWTQPAGEVHVTAAKGEDALAYIEVEDSFGVLPAAEAFDSGAQALNVYESNIVWRSISPGVKVVDLWENPVGTLVQTGPDATVKLQGEGKVIVISGLLRVGELVLKPGSKFDYINAEVISASNAPCIFYVRSSNKLKLN